MPTSRSSVFPNSVMLARTGASTACLNFSSSLAPSSASGKRMSAPSSRYDLARSIAPESPSTARASVRAQMAKPGSRRAPRLP